MTRKECTITVYNIDENFKIAIINILVFRYLKN